MNPMLYLLSTTCIYACFIFFKSLEKSRMGTRLLEFGGIRLRSTSQLSLWNWSLHLKIGVIFPLSILWGYILYTNMLCIQALSIDIILICSYMWDLTSWAHIWYISGFVLKTGCYNIYSGTRRDVRYYDQAE